MWLLPGIYAKRGKSTSDSFENNWSAQGDSFWYGAHFEGSRRLLAVRELMI